MSGGKKKHIHFMGIGGSGMSGVALFAKHAGFRVTGCDLEEKTAYIRQLRAEKIFTSVGHSQSHLKDVDILVTTPAVFYQNKNHPELVNAKMALTWQEFFGTLILHDKKVIAVCGTHGKSTTTALVANLLEAAEMDPNVFVGAIGSWGKSYKLGKSNKFVIEADEFNNNFLFYKPNFIILNNIEFDHPDFFESQDQIYESFKKFIKKLTGEKVLIINQDSFGIKTLFKKYPKLLSNKKLQVYGYTLDKNPALKIKNSFYGEVTETSSEFTYFTVKSDKLVKADKYQLSIPGIHNVSNALGVIVLAHVLKIPHETTAFSLKYFEGIKRRLEHLGAKNGICVYDDYAHHPTAVRVTLNALRQRYPKRRIWAVMEAHSFSRTKALLNDYKDAFKDADKVIVGPIFKARDKKTFGVTGQSIVEVSEHKDIVYKKSLEEILGLLKKTVKKGDVILVMGAGKSYLWAREILKSI